MNAGQDTSGFATMIRSTLASPSHAESVLADARCRIRYREIAPLLESIQALCAERGLQRDDCVTLEVTNSVPAAIVALALLDYGVGLAPLPAPGRGARVAGREFPQARFSRWIVTAGADAGAAARWDLAEPSTFLKIAVNPAFEAPLEVSGGTNRIYLRTSGSLSAPKLVAHRREGYLANALRAGRWLGLEPSVRLALPSPIFHAYGLSVGLLASVANGVSIDFQERPNLLRFFEREAEFDPNVAFMTPTFCEILARGRRARRPYRFILTGGDKIGADTFARCEALHGTVINAYGSTELGFIFCGEPGMPSALRARTVGRPLPGVEFRIVGAPDAPANADTGALEVRSSTAFECYVDLNGRPIADADAFHDDWFCTRDLVRPCSEGTLEVLGRTDLSVNRHGALMTFAEAEAVFREIDSVQEAAVAAGPETVRGRMLVAFCVLAPGARHSAKDIRNEYAKRAPAFAVPDVVHVLEELPRLPTGKIDRTRIAALAATFAAT